VELINRTPYRIDGRRGLATITTAVYGRLRKEEGELDGYDLILVDVRQRGSRDNSYSGWCITYDGADRLARIVVCVPSPYHRHGCTATVRGFAGVVAHELLHLWDYSHGEMPDELVEENESSWEDRWLRSRFGVYLPLKNPRG
jgi:hypothetical protein